MDYEKERAEFIAHQKAFSNGAFPIEVRLQYKSRPESQYHFFNKGLSKREYFTAMAMHPVFINSFGFIGEAPISDKKSIALLAAKAVEYADAVIEELNK